MNYIDPSGYAKESSYLENMGELKVYTDGVINMRKEKVQNVIKYRMYPILVVIGLTMLYSGCKNKTQEKHLSDFFDLKNEKIDN